MCFLFPDIWHTVCPRSSDPFYIVTYYVKWVTTSWTYSNRSSFLSHFFFLFGSYFSFSLAKSLFPNIFVTVFNFWQVYLEGWVFYLLYLYIRTVFFWGTPLSGFVASPHNGNSKLFELLTYLNLCGLLFDSL